MEKSKQNDPFATWLKAYRGAARRDKYRQVAARLEGVGYDPRRAHEVVEDTIHCIALTTAFFGIDGRAGLEAFLRLQAYDVSASGARYLLRFEPFAVAFLLVDDLDQVDLVDLFDSPPGFRHLYVNRVDEKDMTKKELKDLVRAVKADFRYDYAPAELVLDIDVVSAGIGVEVYEVDRCRATGAHH